MSSTYTAAGKRRAKRAERERRAELAAAGILPTEASSGRRRGPQEDPRAAVAWARCKALGELREETADDGTVTLCLPDRARVREILGPAYGTPHWVAAMTEGPITPRMAAAGDEYAKDRARYDALCLGLRLTAHSGVYRGVYDEEQAAAARRVMSRWRSDGAGAALSPLDGDEDARRAKAAHGAAHAVLCGAGMRAEREVVRVCVRLDDETAPKIASLKAGLEALELFYGEAGRI